jgi:hypothetical protein
MFKAAAAVRYQYGFEGHDIDLDIPTATAASCVGIVSGLTISHGVGLDLLRHCLPASVSSAPPLRPEAVCMQRCPLCCGPHSFY